MRSPTTVSVPPTLMLEGQDTGLLTDSNVLALNGPKARVQVDTPQALKNFHSFLGIRIAPIVGECLLDTGASATSIDTEIAAKLNLLTIDTVIVSTAFKGNVTAALHPSEIMLFGYTFIVHQTVSSNLKPHGIVALIGRDILSLGVLDYSGKDGTYNFHIPGLTPD